MRIPDKRFVLPLCNKLCNLIVSLNPFKHSEMYTRYIFFNWAETFSNRLQGKKNTVKKKKIIYRDAPAGDPLKSTKTKYTGNSSV